MSVCTPFLDHFPFFDILTWDNPSFNNAVMSALLVPGKFFAWRFIPQRRSTYKFIHNLLLKNQKRIINTEKNSK